MSVLDSVKRSLRRRLRQRGFDFVRVTPPDRRYEHSSFNPEGVLPDGAEEHLRRDHPRLVELRERYRRFESPLTAPTRWQKSYLEDELDLVQFRGDNAYVWQFRNLGASAAERYYLYLRDIAARDSRGLLDTLKEDGAFGCWTFSYPGWPTVSRDLLDSVNELYFLQEHTGFLDQAWTVLDIGAGYGRLANRALAAAPRLKRYLCTDGVAESTFLCEYYLGFRGDLDRAEVVPVDEMDDRFRDCTVDLAVNIHSFSEMSTAAINSWLDLLADLEVPYLLVVPNDAHLMLSSEADGSRADFRPLFHEHGYRLDQCVPVLPDPTMREFMAVDDHFFLFERRTVKR